MALNFVTFNQDYSLLAVGRSKLYLAHVRRLTYMLGTSRGFRLYSTDPFSKVFETGEGDVSILEMLFSTSLVALILSPRLLRIQNTKVGVQGKYCSAEASLIATRGNPQYASSLFPQ